MACLKKHLQSRGQGSCLKWHVSFPNAFQIFWHTTVAWEVRTRLMFIRLRPVAMCQSLNSEAQAVGLVRVDVYRIYAYIAPACPMLRSMHMPCSRLQSGCYFTALNISQRDDPIMLAVMIKELPVPQL